MSSPGQIRVPRTLDEALDPVWLECVLASVIGGAKIKAVEPVEIIRTMATKVRFLVVHENGTEALCLKGFLDADAETARGGSTMIREADFYSEIAPHVPMRLADCVVKLVDRAALEGAIIMRDLVADGAQMCDALKLFDVDTVAGTLEQLAGLHARNALLDKAPWITRRVSQMADAPYLSAAAVQDLFDGPRGVGLPRETCNADTLTRALKALAARDIQRPQVILHGDCHAGNVFVTDAGPGFLDWQVIQRGGWALDVAYHVNALLPVDVAAQEEERLLRHYLATARSLGSEPPDFAAAFDQYREAAIYGFYMWAITRRVAPEITNLNNHRLGMAVTRLASYRMLGLT